MRYTLFVPILALGLLAACGGKSKDSTATPMAHGDSMGSGGMGMMNMKMGMAAPSSDSQAVLAKVKDYASWPKFAENLEPKLSKAHMDMYVVTYHNDVVAAAIKSKTLPLPDGALIVKQNKMKADESPHALTIMSKQGGKWYWLEASPDGMVMTMNDMPQEGYDAPMCVKCHTDASNNDFMFTHSFAK